VDEMKAKSVGGGIDDSG